MPMTIGLATWMKNSNRLLQVLVICSVCVSCAPIIPIPMRHYYPEVEGGEIIYDQCPINRHLPYGILLSDHGVRTVTRLGIHKKKPYIEVRFKIPEGNIVKLVGATGKLFVNQTDPITQLEFQGIYRAQFSYVIDSPDLIRRDTLEIDEPMVGETNELNGTSWLASYWLASYVELPDSETFQIVLPQFTVNEELITLPSIRFDRKWVVGFWVINC